MKSILLGITLAGLAVFVWGFLFWSSPLPSGAFAQTTNDEEVQQLLRNYFPESGLYIVPGLGHTPEEMRRLYQQGPRALIRLRLEGSAMPDTSTMLLGLVHNLMMAALFAGLLRFALSALPDYKKRVLFVLFAGGAGTLFVLWGDSIWWFAPYSFFVLNLIYHLGAYLIMGLILGRFVRPT